MDIYKMKSLILSLLIVILSITVNAQLTTSICLEPINFGLGVKAETYTSYNTGVYLSYTKGTYKLIQEEIKCDKLSIGVIKYLENRIYYQIGLAFSKWNTNSNSYIFEQKITPEVGMGYLFPNNFNFGIRYNPLKIESSFDIGYTFKF